MVTTEAHNQVTVRVPWHIQTADLVEFVARHLRRYARSAAPGCTFKLLGYEGRNYCYEIRRAQA